MTEMDEIVHEFLVESHENLDQLDQDLVALEREPDSRQLLGSIFRTIHTIKGTSGFLAYNRLEAVTHVGENLLSRLRDGELALTEEMTSALLALVDAVRGLLARIEADGTEGETDHADLIANLTRLAAGLPAQRTAEEPTAPASPAEEPAAATGEPLRYPDLSAVPELPVEVPVEVAVAPAPVPAPAEADAAAAVLAAGPLPLLGELLVRSGAVAAEDVALGILEQRTSDDGRRLGEILVDRGAVSSEDLDAALAAQNDPRRSAAESSIRVDVDLLDTLMTLVGELVLTRNQILAHSSGVGVAGLTRASQRLNLIASELQAGVMKTRMQPLETVWNKLPRVVRDLSLSCGKQVRVQMEGKDTELDRTVLEAIKDPLTHLVRNAVDHAVETPEVRTAAGKPAEGVLRLRAFHESGQVIIEISDDGRGIDPAVVGAKAVERGIVAADRLAGMGDREVVELIFLPGFSTAAAVTNVSGRGVGMDVVKTNIEKIGGSIDVASTVGEGTTFRVKIPLTLAIIPALTVVAAGDRYAIPQVSLLELVRIEGDAMGGAVEHIHGAPVHRLRGNLLPLVSLDRELGLTPRADADREALYIVVLQAEDRRFGLVVDDVLDTEEIVVKPLSAQLKAIRSYAGATILGDGSVGLILDVLSVASQAGVLGAREGATTSDRGRPAVVEDEDGTESLLIVGLSDSRRMAIPLAMVTRLEEIAEHTVERVGGREVVQYRDAILPLVRLDRHLGADAAPRDPQERLQVVVYSERQRSVGIVVGQILDITEQVVRTRSDLDDHGLLGSAVLQDQITGLLDVRQALLAADPHFYRDEVVVAGCEAVA